MKFEAIGVYEKYKRKTQNENRNLAAGPICVAGGGRGAETGNEDSMSVGEKRSTTSRELKEESFKKGPVNSCKHNRETKEKRQIT